jgi:phenylpropionate dioxygenase-like ring-hydroxylating dioxygenase large terminal subunit
VNLDFNKKGLFQYDFQIDLPCDHSFLVENLLDSAHIPVSHDKTEGLLGFISKENAQPLIMKLVGDSNAKGFVGTSQNTKKMVNKYPILSKWLPFFMKKSPPRATQERRSTGIVSFEAPRIIHHQTEVRTSLLGQPDIVCQWVGEDLDSFSQYT